MFQKKSSLLSVSLTFYLLLLHTVAISQLFHVPYDTTKLEYLTVLNVDTDVNPIPGDSVPICSMLLKVKWRYSCVFFSVQFFNFDQYQTDVVRVRVLARAHPSSYIGFFNERIACKHTCLFSLVTGIWSPSSFRSYSTGFPKRSVCDI